MTETLKMTSTAFQHDGKIPVLYSCNGKDISPPLAWHNVPEATEAFALICSDPDAPAGTWYHWILFNIPANTTEILENQIPINCVVGKNSWGRTQYNGPCPPPGKPHRYFFTLYALNTQLNLPPGTNATTLEEVMQGHLLESDTLIGLFGREKT